MLSPAAHKVFRCTLSVQVPYLLVAVAAVVFVVYICLAVADDDGDDDDVRTAGTRLRFVRVGACDPRSPTGGCSSEVSSMPMHTCVSVLLFNLRLRVLIAIFFFYGRYSGAIPPVVLVIFEAGTEKNLHNTVAQDHVGITPADRI